MKYCRIVGIFCNDVDKCLDCYNLKSKVGEKKLQHSKKR